MYVFAKKFNIFLVFNNYFAVFDHKLIDFNCQLPIIWYQIKKHEMKGNKS